MCQAINLLVELSSPTHFWGCAEALVSAEGPMDQIFFTGIAARAEG